MIINPTGEVQGSFSNIEEAIKALRKAKKINPNAYIKIWGKTICSSDAQIVYIILTGVTKTQYKRVLKKSKNNPTIAKKLLNMTRTLNATKSNIKKAKAKKDKTKLYNLKLYYKKIKNDIRNEIKNK